MVLANIIVDVPLMQTDQPYSYRIPKEFEGMLEVGMRVHVPFGKGNRLIQGIVPVSYTHLTLPTIYSV